MTNNVVFIEPKIITCVSSYWAMFYSAIFKALAYQTNMEFPLGEKSPQEHRGDLNTPQNYLSIIRKNLQNHAFEYIMMDLLRSEYGANIRYHLVNRLLELYGITDFEYSYLNIFKMGKDSVHYKLELDRPFDVKVITPKNNEHSQPLEVTSKLYQGFTYPINIALTNFPNSDLLLVVSDGKNHTYGFLGEIEGNRGVKLFQRTYWSGEKGKYATFGIGISEKNTLRIHGDSYQLSNNIVLFRDENYRQILNYSNITHFARDYHRAITNMELYFNGQTQHVGTGNEEGHDHVLSLIRSNWGNRSKAIIEVLSEQVNYAHGSASPVYNQQDSETKKWSFKPNILALENWYCLHPVIGNYQI
ncbi:hypothetical protein [Xenorhabdus bovienii]|uniref:hypothetical protein n=1 Tax=Xenorhabdus bovienii TaxID=40576 RepID=UPI003DA3E6C3